MWKCNVIIFNVNNFAEKLSLLLCLFYLQLLGKNLALDEHSRSSEVYLNQSAAT